MTAEVTGTATKNSIVPWLSVRDSARAVEFYMTAFGATEVFRMEDSGSIVARLAVDGAEFWVSEESPEHANFSPDSLGGGTVRMILMVGETDEMFGSALKAGATEIFPMGEAHGWRLGRVKDPFGHSWEICRPLMEKY